MDNPYVPYDKHAFAGLSTFANIPGAVKQELLTGSEPFKEISMPSQSCYAEIANTCSKFTKSLPYNTFSRRVQYNFEDVVPSSALSFASCISPQFVILDLSFLDILIFFINDTSFARYCLQALRYINLIYSSTRSHIIQVTLLRALSRITFLRKNGTSTSYTTPEIITSQTNE